MKRIHALSLLALLPFIVLRGPAPALAAEAVAVAAQRENTLVFEDWSVMSMAGGKVGYIHTVVRQSGEGDAARFEMTVDSRMKINRLGSTIEIENSQVSLEDARGLPLRMDAVGKLSARETITAVTFADGRARVTTTVMGKARESQVECPADVIGPYRMGEVVKSRSREAGTTFELRTWMAELNQPTAVSITIVGPEAVVVDGEKRTLLRYDSTSEIMGTVTTTSWVDDGGVAIRTETKLAGMLIESHRSTEAEALAAYAASGELSPDVFSATLIAAQEFLPVPRRLESAHLRLRPRRAGVVLQDLADERQRRQPSKEEGVVELWIGRLVPPEDHGGVRPIGAVPEGLELALAPSSMIQSDHEDIRGIADEIVGSETDAWRAAQSIERWVAANVTEKGMDVGFASALEVCVDRAGDCSEHAVLLCALARAAGIPSRVAMGLLYVGGIWGGHAWTEVWIDGRWYALDGTLGLGYVDPLHLSLATMNLADGNPAADFAQLLQTLGEIEIEVLEVSHAGRRMDLLAEDSVRIEENRYVNELWGIALEKPTDFAFERKLPKKRIDFEVLQLVGRTPDGVRCRVELLALDALLPPDWAGLLGAGDAALLEFEVDGRKARSADDKKETRTARRIAIDAGDAVFLLKLDRIDGADQQAMLAALLASIDLDVGRR